MKKVYAYNAGNHSANILGNGMLIIQIIREGFM